MYVAMEHFWYSVQNSLEAILTLISGISIEIGLCWNLRPNNKKFCMA